MSLFCKSVVDEILKHKTVLIDIGIVGKLHVESLEQDVIRKESQLHSIFQSKSESDSNATHYKLRSETLEELLQKQKDEHDRVFTLLQNRLKVIIILCPSGGWHIFICYFTDY